MTSTDDRATELRHHLVDQLRDRGAVRSPAVEAAMRAVPRHRFLGDVWLPPPDRPRAMGDLEHHVVDPATVTDELLDRLYSDIAVVTRRTDGQPTSSSSQPTVVAEMLERLRLGPGLRVLEVGAGTGYNAALLAELVGDPSLVVTIDITADIADRARASLAALGYGGVTVLCSDGADGHAAGGPYDRIVATVGCQDLAPAWLEQLAPGGMVLLPLEHGGLHPITEIGAGGGGRGGEAFGRAVSPAGFMTMQGQLAEPGRGPEPGPAAAAPGAEPIRRSPLPADLDAGALRGTSAWPGWDAGYFLRLADHRAAGVALRDSGGAAGVALDTGELLERGDSDHLASALVDHLREWVALGRPSPPEWRSTFRRRSGDDDHAGAVRERPRYRVERVHFTQEAALEDPAG